MGAGVLTGLRLADFLSFFFFLYPFLSKKGKMGARRDGKAACREEPRLEWKAKANQAGDEIILNKHEVTDDSILSYFN